MSSCPPPFLIECEKAFVEHRPTDHEGARLETSLLATFYASKPFCDYLSTTIELTPSPLRLNSTHCREKPSKQCATFNTLLRIFQAKNLLLYSKEPHENHVLLLQKLLHLLTIEHVTLDLYFKVGLVLQTSKFWRRGVKFLFNLHL